MKKFTDRDIEAIKRNIVNLVAQRKTISSAIFKERQKLYNHRKYLKRKLQK